MDEILNYFSEKSITWVLYYFTLTCAGIFSLINRPSNKSILLLQIYLILVVLIEFSALYVNYLGEYNVWIYNILVLIQFPLITKILFSQFEKKNYKQFENVCLAFFIIFPLLNFLFWQGVFTFNTITLQIGAIYGVILSLLHLKSLLDNPEKSIASNPHFYISIAFLIYFTGTILYFSFFSLFSKSDIITFKQISIILQLINWVTYSLFILAILFDRKSNHRKKMSRVF